MQGFISRKCNEEIKTTQISQENGFKHKMIEKKGIKTVPITDMFLSLE